MRAGDASSGGGDALVFPAAANRPTPSNDIVGLSLTTIQVTGTATGNTRYSISGTQAITLTNGLILAAPVDGLFAGPRFTVPIKLGAALVISNSGTSPTLLGTIDLNGFQLTFNPGSANINAANTISGSGSITKAGAATLFLEGNNTFAGPMQINNGIVRARTNTALGDPGSGTTVAFGATLVTELGITIAEPLTLNGGTLSSETLANTWSGPVTLTASSSISVVSGTDPLTLSGAISGSFTLTKMGPGAAILTGNSPALTGLLLESAGVLQVNANFASGSANVTGGTFGGIGTVGTFLAPVVGTFNGLPRRRQPDDQWHAVRHLLRRRRWQ